MQNPSHKNNTEGVWKYIPAMVGAIWACIGVIAAVFFIIYFRMVPTNITIFGIDFNPPTLTPTNVFVENNIPTQLLANVVNTTNTVISPTATFTVTIPPMLTSTFTPTVSPTSTPNLTLFWDDFNEGLKADWQLDYGIWQMVNEQLVITEGVGDRSAVIYIGDAGWRDYAVNLDVGEFTRDAWSGDEGTVTLYVRSLDQHDGMWFHMELFSASCGIEQNGISQRVNELNPMYFDSGDRHIRIESLGNKYEFWINDERICFFEDNTFSQGRVVLKGRNGRGDPTWIDNFKITQLP